MLEGIIATASFFIHILLRLCILTVLFRLLVELSGVTMSNPIAEWVIKLTNSALKPLRQVLPSLWIALLLLLFSLEFVHQVSLSWLQFPTFPKVTMLLMWSLGSLIQLTLNVYFYVILLAVALNGLLMLKVLHLSPYSPIYVLLNQLMAPIVRPIRNALPPMSGIDFSPLIMLILIYGFQLFFSMAIPSPRW